MAHLRFKDIEFPCKVNDILRLYYSEGLIKDIGLIVAAFIEDELVDLFSTVDSRPSNISFVSINSDLGINILRHSAAHLLAHAVKEIYGSDIFFSIGPTTENGFFYDFKVSKHFSLHELSIIENKMREISNKKIAITKKVVSRKEAISIFEHDPCKLQIIKSIPENLQDELSIYIQGDFFDLCKGPHVPHTGFIKNFKLTNVSSARSFVSNDSNDEFCRIHGVCFDSKEGLVSYFKMLEEAKERDHKKLGSQLDLFHFQNEAIGQVFWHRKGWVLYRVIEDYLRKLTENSGYEEVKTPILVSSDLWKKSGHLDKFAENMILLEIGNQHSAVKPMNCPCHVQIYKNRIKSYRDLPLRMSEFGCCHRNESSGSMDGLMRVRGFNQDDGHIFCTEDQIKLEVKLFCNTLFEAYKKFGFHSTKVKFADRPAVRSGENELWDKVESILLSAIEDLNIDYQVNKGEGAFYGPKLEFVLKDAIGRDWQCGTLQVDFVLPKRLGAYYIDSDGEKKHPVMLHRAIIGTFERFIGILIENCKGRFPFWLSPVQISVLSISDDVNEYAQFVHKYYLDQGLRSIVDCQDDLINSKIRRHISEHKVPVLCIVGSKESQSQSVSLRFGVEKGSKTFSLTDSLAVIKGLN